MARIAVLDSDKRRIDIKTLRENLSEHTVERIALDGDTIDTPIDQSIDFAPYRALYVRVGNVTDQVLSRGSNLEIVSTCGSGYNHIDLKAATRRGIMVTHTPEAPAPGAIEHTFGFIFALLNRFPAMFEQTSKGNWSEGQTIVEELYDRTIGVVGLGTIGSEVAKIAQNSFNADVIAYDPYVDGSRYSPIYPRVSREEIENAGINLVDKHELFQSASLVTVHVPLNAETRGMVGREELKALEGGYLINLSRGGVVDEKSLIDAVEHRLLKGVALDVVESEPPEANHPLLGMPRVYITPHIAGGKEGYSRRSALINARRITRALRGEKPKNLINPEVLDGEKFL
jgi:D-3-phosphoglycerate dehydrogenase